MRKVLGLVVLTLAACGGGGGGNDAAAPPDPAPPSPPQSLAGCTPITGGSTAATTSVDTGCANCSASNAPLAMDADLNTKATLSVNNAAPGSGAALRVTAQSGIVFPAGQQAGAFVGAPSGDGQSYSITTRTYLGGVLQESATNSNGGVCGVCGNGGHAFYGLTTTKQFDAVETFINNNQAPGTPPDFGVYEACSEYKP